MDRLIVSKFGGSVISTAEGVKRAVEIIKSDPARRYVIASAPGSGSRESGITDMLFMCYSSFRDNGDYQTMLDKISEHYQKIIAGVGMRFDIEAEIEYLKQDLISGRKLDYIGSRGEYIMGKILAELLGWTFVDASELIFFNNDGTLDEAQTFSAASARLKSVEHAVIPGFYGSMPDGEIKTFQRGDGDSSGAIIARAVNADLFEKWSEVVRVFSADSNVVPDACLIRKMTYDEALEMNYITKSICKDSVMLMLKEAGIPMRVGSVCGDDCTLISVQPSEENRNNVAVCITGRRNFKIFHITKYELNKISGFGEKLLGIFARYGVACEHCLSGIHKFALVIRNPMFELRRNEIFADINHVIEPTSITVDKDLSLITVIGEGMGTVSGKFEKIFLALKQAKINVKMLDQGADDLNIIIGVSDKDYSNAVRALYETIILGAQS